MKFCKPLSIVFILIATISAALSAEIAEVEKLLKQKDYSSLYRSIKASGNNSPDEEIVAYMLKENGYTKWNKLSSADKAKILTKVCKKK